MTGQLDCSWFRTLSQPTPINSGLTAAAAKFGFYTSFHPQGEPETSKTGAAQRCNAVSFMKEAKCGWKAKMSTGVCVETFHEQTQTLKAKAAFWMLKHP